MQQADVLELLAELSVAFAGFTGLVGALRLRRDQDQALRGELRILIEFSLYLMIASLVPLFLWQAGASEASAWRIASLGHVVFIVVYYVRRARTLLANAVAAGNASVFWGTLAVESVIGSLVAANGLGLLPWPLHVVYLGNLFYQLIGTALSFMRFAAPLWRGETA